MSLTLIAAPAVEPVTLAEIKLQCGLGPMEDSDQLREQTLAEQLRAAVMAARGYAEQFLGRALITQTWMLTLERFPHAGDEYAVRDRQDIALPLPKFGGLVGFTYLDTGGTLQNMLSPGSWGYQVVSGGDTTPARLRPPAMRGWPVTQWDTADTVAINFNCGYGATPAAVPAPIRNAIKIAAQHLFEQPSRPMPQAVDLMLGPYRNPYC